MVKVLRTLITILVMTSGLTGYCLWIAPQIEPPPVAVEVLDPDKSGSPIDSYIYLDLIFNPGDWELNDPRILEIGDYKVLLDNYSIQDNNKIIVDRCSMIIASPDQSLTAIERITQSTVIRCPEGGVLEFQYPVLEGSFSKDNRIVSGKLKGKISVSSQGALPGDEDDFHLTAYDVSVKNGIISTPSDVFFTYGSTEGNFTGVSIQLISQDLIGNAYSSTTGGFQQSQKIIVDQITVNKLNRLYLTMPGKAFSPKQSEPVNADGKPQAGADGKDSLVNLDLNVPIELRCEGEVVYNALQKTATLSKKVSLQRMIDGPEPDMLLCELLSLNFCSRSELEAKKQKFAASQNLKSPLSTAAGSAPTPTTASTDGSGSPLFHGSTAPSNVPLLSNNLGNDWDLAFESMLASGRNAVLRSPSRNFALHSSQIQYNAIENKIEVESFEPAQLYIGNHELHANSLTYNIIKGQKVGHLTCSSGGWVKSVVDPDSGDYVRAFWSEGMTIGPDAEDPSESVASLIGQVHMDYTSVKKGISSLYADKIDFWLKQQTTSESKIAASKDDTYTVNANHPSTVTAWGTDIGALSPPTVSNAAAEQKFSLTLSRMQAAPNVVVSTSQVSAHLDKVQLWFSPSSTPLPTQDSPAFAQLEDGPADSAATEDVPKKSRFLIQGKLLLGQILTRQSDMYVSQLTIENEVVVQEESAAGQESKPELTSESGSTPVATAQDSASPQAGFVGSGNAAEAATPQTAQKSKGKKLYLSGERITLTNPLAPNIEVTALGSPAQLEANNMKLVASGIKFNRAHNLINIDEAGSITLEELPDPQGQGGRSLFSFLSESDEDSETEAQTERSAAGAIDAQNKSKVKTQMEPVVIKWSDRMTFDGARIVFWGNIDVKTNAKRIYPTGTVQDQSGVIVCDLMTIMLNQYVDLQKSSMDEKISVHKILLDQNVMIEMRVNEAGKRISFDRLCANSLIYDMNRNTVSAKGKGQVTTWRYQNGNSFDALALSPASTMSQRYAAGNTAAVHPAYGQQAPFALNNGPGNNTSAKDRYQTQTVNQITADPTKAQNPEKPELIYLNMNFMRSMELTLKPCIFNFSHGVSIIYGPIDEFGDTLTSNSLVNSPSTFTMSCDSMSIMLHQLSEQKARQRAQEKANAGIAGDKKARRFLLDLAANGNVNLEGKSFNATAHRLTYCEEQDHMIMEGDEQTGDTEILYQSVSCGPVQRASGSKINFWPHSRRFQVEGMQTISIDNMIK